MTWNNVLNPQLENIADIRDVEAYLRNMTFQRRFLGYDAEEVQDCLAEVSRQYRRVIASLLSQQGQDTLAQDLQVNLDRMRAESEALYDWNKRFQQTSSMLFRENDRLLQENAAQGEWIIWYEQENAALRAALSPGGYYYQT